MRHFPPRVVGDTGWNGRRNRAMQARFRKQVFANAGGRCQFVQDRVRCSATHELQAHHTQPGNDDPATGVLLCRHHHRAVDPYAR